MPANNGDFLNLIALLKQATDTLVTQVMQAQVLDAHCLTCADKCIANHLRVVGENDVVTLWLIHRDLKATIEQRDRLMIAKFLPWVLAISDNHGTFIPIQIAPLNTKYLSPAHC